MTHFKNSLNVNIFKLILLSFLPFLALFSTSYAQQTGASYTLPFKDLPSNGYEYHNGIYRHRTDAFTYDLFVDNSTTNPTLSIPVPKVTRTVYKSSNCAQTNLNCGLYLDDPYPDGIFANTPNSSPKINPSNYTKKCNSDESSVFYYIKVSNLVLFNINVPSDESLINVSKDSNGNVTSYNFKSSKLNNQNNNYILFEYCYSSAIKELINENKQPVNLNQANYLIRDDAGNTFGRKIIGGANQEIVTDIYPPELSNSNQYKASYSARNGSNISQQEFTSADKSTQDISVGYRYGEFQVTFTNNIGSCDLGSQPLIGSDLFGKKVLGVNTALGCLPGSFEGVFAVVLRITIGISGALLFIIILFNAFGIIQSQNNPEKIKKYVGNISRSVAALITILLSIVILNFVGIKILQLESLGSTESEHILGK